MSYEEKRVRVAAYGTVAKGSPLLVKVPGVGGKPRLLHTLAAKAHAALSAAAAKEVAGLAGGLRLASGWRPHRWTSRAQYEKVLVQRFGSVAEGRKWLAFDSPHETGLAIDIGVGGLTPSRSTRDAQRRTPLHGWLVERASDFGWHPYKIEPWHWEFPLSRRAWESGQPDPGGALPVLLAAEAEGEQAEPCEDEIPEEP